MVDFNSQKFYTIAPSTPFLSHFATNLLDGKIIDEFAYDPENPHLLSQALIYVPTRRAVRSLRAEIATQIGKGSVILPDIRPLGEAEDDLDAFEDISVGDFPAREPISGTQSKLILAELILAWKQSLPKIFSAQLKSVPLVAPANPADAVWLGDALMSLLQSAESEEIDLNLIDKIVSDDHAQWWQLTLEFLKILREYWPARLLELNRQSATRYQIAQIDRQAKYLSDGGHVGPVIVAGSTGSLPATARLMGVVASLDQGAIILPGLDQNMAREAWQNLFTIAQNVDQSHVHFDLSKVQDRLPTIVVQGHPQFGLARLLTRMHASIDHLFEIKALGQSQSHLMKRDRIVSKALLPADLTDDWSAHKTDDLIQEAAAFENVSLIEADNERDEAASIAAAIRLALEPSLDNPSPDVALVTPDRNLGRRVSIELLKYHIEADDSGGASLTQTKLGDLLKCAAELTFKASDNELIAALIKHPLAPMGWSDNERMAAASALERLVLRRHRRDIDPRQLPQLVAAAYDELAQSTHVPKYLADIEDQHDQVVDLAEHIAQIFNQIINLKSSETISLADYQKHVAPLSFWIEKTVQLMDALTISADGTYELWDSETGTNLIALIEDVRNCPTDMQVAAFEWANMLEPLLNGCVVKPKTGSHPRVMIWGALEARLQTVDTMIMAGLNEGTWPSTSSNDPFLSRSMKSEIGLEPPERRLGLAAHDFQMGMGAKNVILSRALKSNGAPTVAARWVQRLLTILSPNIVAQIKARGAEFANYASQSPQKDQSKKQERPNPYPPKEFQPNSFSFSEVSTLRRDPYAIYARKILKLDPLDDFAAEPDLRDRGSLYHSIIEQFWLDFNNIQNGSHAQHLEALIEQAFHKHDLPKETDLLWRHRFMQVAPHLITWEMARHDEVLERHVEMRGRYALPNVSDGPALDVTIGGLADRIDLMIDGGVEILDFKTGIMPSAKEARSLLDPQLPLEAYVLSKGGFAPLPARTTTSLKYVRLKPADHLIVDQVEAKPTKTDQHPKSAAQLGETAANELSKFVAALQNGQFGYLSRAIPKRERDMSGDYDHLARVAEWSVIEPPDEGEPNG